MARVRRTKAARQDLKRIGRFVANESRSLSVALKLVDSIAVRCEHYASRPLMGEACPDLGHEIRRFVFRNYAVYYRPTTDGIDVLRVLHASRDIPTAWREPLD